MNYRKPSLRKFAVKLLAALAASALLVVLSTFNSIGYKVEGIQEISFSPQFNYGCADAVFKINMTFNPLLYPFQWLIGKGSISSTFSMIYLPHAYERGEFGPPIFGSTEEHYNNYISYAASSTTFANVFILLALTITIELLKKRIVYLALFTGIAGFLITGVNGTIFGLIIGAIFAKYISSSKYKVSLTGLRGYILKRITYSFALVILVITINFIIFMKMPSNPMDLFTAPTRSESEVEVVARLWGLNQPLIPQYFTYLRNLLTFNLGNVGRTLRNPEKEIIPVVESLKTRLPYTIFILGTSTLFSIIVGVLIGCFMIYKRGRVLDTMSALFSSILTAMPVQWVGAILLMVFAQQLRWLPYEGAYPLEWRRNPPTVLNTEVSYSQVATNISLNLNLAELWRLLWGYLAYALLPILTLIISQVGTWVFLTRASLIQMVGEQYLITAKAKGVTDWNIVAKHALRNACLPIITSVAISFGFIVSGSVIIEGLFQYPGVGLWLFDAVRNLDYVVLMTVFYVIALCVIIANAIADVLYGILDPRINRG